VPDKINDKVSSIRVAGGEAWEVCEDSDYRGQCQPLSGSVADLSTKGGNDRISSLRPVDNARFRDRRSGDVSPTGADQALLFFDRSGFMGSSTLVKAGASNLRLAGWQGSVELRGGGAWELCDSSGTCVTIDQDVADISRLGLKGQITSARPVNPNPYRRNDEN